MSATRPESRAPFELIISMVGGLGTDFTKIVKELKKHFESSGCEFEELRLTRFLDVPKDVIFLDDLDNKIKKIDNLRSSVGPGVMAFAAVKKILESRNSNNPRPKVYVINSLKHPMEYDVLRHIYRRNFVLLSVYEHKEKRLENLKQNQLGSLKDCAILSDDDVARINELMISDENDLAREHGRQTLELYHKSHYFIHSSTLLDDVARFFKIILNHPFITPTREEVGMMYAYYTSLRSSDLSRQVGAAILSDDGDILTTGLNEVPKFGGGLHWCDTEPNYRDYNHINDNNELISHDCVRKLL